MRVLVASAPHADTFGYSMPPPGLLRLGGALLEADFDVRLEDLAFRMAEGTLPADDRLADASAAWLLRPEAGGPPDVLGLSVMGATLPIALAIAEHVRRAAPETRVLLGGPGTTGVDTQVLERFRAIDVVVRGEAEVTLLELLERLDDPRGVAGVTWRRADGGVEREPDRAPISDLDSLPPYAWELLPPIAEYKRVTGEVEGLVPVDSGRGCVYDCSFCTIGRYWGRRSRPLPAPRLADEIAALRGIPSAKRAYLCHDLFAANRRHALDLCAELKGRGVQVPWEVRARVDHLDAELLGEMARAGCYRVLLGVESADAEVRARANKATSDDLDVLGVVDACASVGITPILSLILGLPGEDTAALERTLDLCAAAALRAGVNLSLHLPNPQPGCGLGEELGAESRPVDGIPPDMAFGTGETAAERELIAAHVDLFTTWALLPLTERKLVELHAIATTLPEILMRYPRTFGVLRRMQATGTLELWREWHATARSFEAFVLAAPDSAALRAAYAWDQAQVRAGARAALEDDALGSSAEPDQVRPTPRAELIASEVDLDALAESLVSGAPLPSASELRDFAVAPAPGAMAGVRTLQVGDGVRAVFDALMPSPGRAQPTLAELRAQRPGLAAAAERLVPSGLVALAPADRQTATPQDSQAGA